MENMAGISFVAQRSQSAAAIVSARKPSAAANMHSTKTTVEEKEEVDDVRQKHEQLSKAKVLAFARIRGRDGGKRRARRRRAYSHGDSRDGEREANHEAKQIVVEEDMNHLSVKGKSGSTYRFAFDGVFIGQGQEEVFETTCVPLLRQSLDHGHSGTVFAYGQTGSGKTYTITGGEKYQNRGLVPRTLTYLFDRVVVDDDYRIFVNYLEVYQEKARNLIDGGKVEIRSEKEGLDKFFQGNMRRVTTGTMDNAFSSRSHTVFTITLENPSNGSSCALSFVDLAGSEKWSESFDKETRNKETRSINLSLHFLEQVILELSNKTKTVTFRNSIMTRILEKSLAGNSRCVFIMTLREECSRESLSTCRFAQRCRSLKWKTEIVQDPRHKDIRKENADLREQLEDLKSKLEEHKRALEELIDIFDPLEDMLTHGGFFQNVQCSTLFGSDVVEEAHIWVSPDRTGLHIGAPRQVLDVANFGAVEMVKCMEQDLRRCRIIARKEIFVSHEMDNSCVLSFDLPVNGNTDLWFNAFVHLCEHYSRMLRQQQQHGNSLSVHAPPPPPVLGLPFNATPRTRLSHASRLGSKLLALWKRYRATSNLPSSTSEAETPISETSPIAK